MKNVIQKSLVEKGANYYSKHLDIINTFFPVRLTPKEIEVLGEFMAKDNPLAENDRFNTVFRKEVKKSLRLTDGGLSNYIRTLRDKAAIKEDENGVLYVNPILFPNDVIQGYQFKLRKDEKSN